MFKRSGISHLLSVSGLHVGILALGFALLFKRCRVPLTFSSPLIIALLILFALITGARPPTVRAAIMASTILIINAYIDPRPRYAVWIGMGISASALLLREPELLFMPTFILSYSAVLSLILMASPLSSYLTALSRRAFLMFLASYALFLIAMTIIPTIAANLYLLAAFIVVAGILSDSNRRSAPKKPPTKQNYIVVLVAAQLSIQVGVIIPMSAIFFGHYSIAGNLVNLVVIPLSALMVPSYLLTAIVELQPLSFLVIPFAFCTEVFSYLCFSISWLGAQLFSYPMLPKPGNLAVIAYYFAVILILIMANAHIKLKKQWKYIIIITFSLAFLSLALLHHPYKLPADRGKCIIIPDAVASSRRSTSTSTILIENGTASLYNPGKSGYVNFQLFPILRNMGINAIEDIIITTQIKKSTLAGVKTLVSFIPVQGHLYTDTIPDLAQLSCRLREENCLPDTILATGISGMLLLYENENGVQISEWL